MTNLIKIIKNKFNGIIWTLVSTGVMFLLLGIIIVWAPEFMVRLTLGLFVLLIAYTFLFLGYRFWSIKREVEKFFKLK